LEAIFEIYQEIVAKHKEQKAVEVFVATKPSEDTTETIKTRLVSTYGEGTNIEFKIDPNIMGGLSIKVGDETLDLSIRGKVKKLINQLNF
jgi:F-type H+-transporting ATPase subunit delta